MSTSEPLAARDLAAFVAAVETGSVQAAADALDLTQSAATKRIQGLERRLGVLLLDRGPRGVSPTGAGRTLYVDAKEALAVLRRAEERVSAAGASEALVLRLAASHTIGGFLLPGWLSRFRAQAPDVQPQVEVVKSPTVLQLVRDGRAHVGFVEGDDDLGDLEELTVGLDELVVVVAAGHRWARRRSVRPAELAGEPFFAREAGSGTRAVAEHRLAVAGTTLVASLQMASTESLKRAILVDGYALLSRHTIVHELAAGTLAALPVQDVDLHRVLRAVRRGEDRRSRAAATLWEWLAADRAGEAPRDA